jgi:hypothetical protein
MNFVLRVGRTWDTQIAAIREAVTEDTNLIRYDNTSYRICSNALPPAFTISVLPTTVSPPLVLNMRTRDLYVELIGGHPFENYSHNLDRMPFEATATSGDDAERGFSLDSAIRGLLRTPGGDKRTLRPDDRFLAQSLVVFCVAESLRFDKIATELGQCFRSSYDPNHPEIGNLLKGVARIRYLQSWLQMAKNWEKTTKDVFDGIPDKMREIVVQPRSRLSPADRQASARVDLAGFGDVTRSIAPGMRVLMRPS